MSNDFQIIMLASGSRGNATLISTARQRVLVDVGISCRTLTSKLKEIRISPEELDGVFITHEHIDHVSGLAKFMETYQVPVYSSAATWRAILTKESKIIRKNCRIIENSLLCGDLRINSFKVPHDAVDTRGYCFTSQSSGSKCTYLTDTGFITELIYEAVKGSNSLILEANHDLEMLEKSTYPYRLKQRILGTLGHLSNDTAGKFLTSLQRLPEHVMLAHLSEKNNKPELALATVRNILNSNQRLQETEIFVASQKDIVTDS